MFHIDNRSRVPIHQQLQAQIVRYVSLGLLLPDQQLPSVRPSLRSWRQIVLPQRYRQRQTPA